MSSLARLPRVARGAAVAAAIACSAVSARAASVPPLNEWTYGIRAGISSSPDQTLVGAHYISPSFIKHRIQLYPSVGVGFGDHVTTWRANADLRYLIPVVETDWTLYFGTGLGYARYQITGPGDSDETGANGVLGGEYRFAGGNKFFGEIRVPLGEIPGPSLIFKDNTLPKTELFVGFTMH